MSDDYKGMSDEAAKDYEKRQAEPLFKSARDMMPMEQTKAHFEAMMCGYRKWDGCQCLTRDSSFYSCIYHQTIHAIGTDFFTYYQLLTDNDFERMTSEQHKKLEARRRYMTKWIDNFPRGA